MAAIVRTDGLTKDFFTGFWRPRPYRALNGLSFEIPEGGVFGLLGPNGAGKSTTLKLLLDLLRPTAGRAELFGRPPGDTAARQRLGFLPENPTFYDYLSADELLRYFAGLFGYTSADCRARAARVLDRAGLSAADRQRPLRQYSKGMVQRVGLAQALVNDPELVILDEPMSGLDTVGRREVREIIVDLRAQGRTVLFSSHILSDAESLCDRVGILARGRLVAAGAVETLTAGAAPGFEIVAAGVTEEALQRLTPRVAGVTRLAGQRVSFVLDGQGHAPRGPESLIAELAAAGATLISVSPWRTTLEDVFMRALGETSPSAEPVADAGGRDR